MKSSYSMVHSREIFMPGDPDNGLEITNTSKYQGGVIFGDERDIELYNVGSNTSAKKRVDEMSRNNDILFAPGEALRSRAALYILLERFDMSHIDLAVSMEQTRKGIPFRVLVQEPMREMLDTKIQNAYGGISGSFGKKDVDNTGPVDGILQKSQQDFSRLHYDEGKIIFEGIHYTYKAGNIFATLRLRNTKESDIEAVTQTDENNASGDLQNAGYMNVFSQKGIPHVTAAVYDLERRAGNKSFITDLIEHAFAGSFAGVYANRVRAFLDGGSDFTSFCEQNLVFGCKIEFEMYEALAEAVSRFSFLERDDENIDSALKSINSLIQHIANRVRIPGVPDISKKEFIKFIEHREKGIVFRV